MDKIALANEKGNAVIHADVTVNNPDEELCIGVGAKAVLTVAEKSDILYLPGEVVNTFSRRRFCLCDPGRPGGEAACGTWDCL